jgi:hypothetical protein
MNFKSSSPAGSSELPADLLPVTISLLLTAIDKLFPRRGCSEVSFAFESGNGEPEIRVAAITDAEGCIVLEQQRILDWRFESSPRLGDLLEAAAELHLDEQFPEWCDGSGSTGTLLFTIRREPDGAIGVHPRGIAWMSLTPGQDPSLSA